MRTRVVKRHHCDFCGKGMFQIPAMQRHELSCTMNPNRVCKMCAMNPNISQSPMDEILKVAEDFHEFEIDTGAVESNEEAIREITNNCPACILAAMRQSGNYLLDFDWKTEGKAWLAENSQYDSNGGIY